MMDFNKAYCNLHPHELITNFCAKEQCLVGLCANCVCTHTQLHVEKETSPEYQNIRATYRAIQDKIRNQIELFEEDKHRIVNNTLKKAKLMMAAEEKKLKARQIVQIAHERTREILQKYFEEKGDSIQRQIEAEEKKSGLHCHSRLDSLDSYVSRQISMLIAAAQEITSNNFLESLPRIRTQTLVNAYNFHQEVKGQLEQNENFHTKVTFNEDILKPLTKILQQSIQLSFSNLGRADKILKKSHSHTKTFYHSEQLAQNQLCSLSFGNSDFQRLDKKGQMFLSQGRPEQAQQSVVYSHVPNINVRPPQKHLQIYRNSMPGDGSYLLNGTLRKKQNINSIEKYFHPTQSINIVALQPQAENVQRSSRMPEKLSLSKGNIEVRPNSEGKLINISQYQTEPFFKESDKLTFVAKNGLNKRSTKRGGLRVVSTEQEYSKKIPEQLATHRKQFL